MLQLVPTAVRISGSSSSSHSTTFQSSETLKNILDSSINIIPDEVVGCSFEYEVNADTEQTLCYFVNICCTFSTKSEFDKFKTLYYNGELAKKLEEYLKPKILESQYGVYPEMENKEFKLEITLLEMRKKLQKPMCTTESEATR